MAKVTKREIEHANIYIKNGVIRKARYGNKPFSHKGETYSFDRGQEVSEADIQIIKNCGDYDGLGDHRGVLVSNENSGYFDN